MNSSELAINTTSEIELLSCLLGGGSVESAALASRLLRRYGSVWEVLSAEEDEIKSVKGMSEKRIKMLSVIPHLCERFLYGALKSRYKTYDKRSLIEYLTFSMRNLRFEIFKLILIDSQMRIMSIKDLFRGSITSSTVYPREVAREILDSGAVFVVVAHNHPSGSTEASDSDNETTRALSIALESVGVRLLDHIIIGDGYFSYDEAGILGDMVEDYYMISEKTDFLPKE